MAYIAPKSLEESGRVDVTFLHYLAKYLAPFLFRFLRQPVLIAQKLITKLTTTDYVSLTL